MALPLKTDIKIDTELEGVVNYKGQFNQLDWIKRQKKATAKSKKTPFTLSADVVRTSTCWAPSITKRLTELQLNLPHWSFYGKTRVNPQLDFVLQRDLAQSNMLYIPTRDDPSCADTATSFSSSSSSTITSASSYSSSSSSDTTYSSSSSSSSLTLKEDTKASADFLHETLSADESDVQAGLIARRNLEKLRVRGSDFKTPGQYIVHKCCRSACEEHVKIYKYVHQRGWQYSFDSGDINTYYCPCSKFVYCSRSCLYIDLVSGNNHGLVCIH